MNDDDLLAEQVNDVFATLTDITVEVGNDTRRVSGPNDPYGVAKMLATYGEATGHPFKSCDERLYIYTGTYWQTMKKASMRSRIYEFLDGRPYIGSKGLPEPWKPNPGHVRNIMQALEAKVDDSDVSTTQEDGAIPVSNGWLIPATRTLLPHTPDRFNTFTTAVEFDPDAPEPASWLKFLSDVLPDEDSQNLLAEWFGYVLSGRVDLHKALFLKGAPRSGKTTIATILEDIIGGGATGISLDSLTRQFGMAPLIGKSLAVIGDARLASSNSLVVERLLSITGQDMVQVEEKYMPMFSTRLPVRLMMLSNELPNLEDTSMALANRFIILETRQSFLGREDAGLLGRLRAELPGILNWALDGLDRLTAQHAFSVPEASLEATKDMLRSTSPLTAFVEDECVLDDDAVTPVSVLFSKYKAWCEQGNVKAMTAQQFGARLHDKGIETGQRRVDGKRPRCYLGIKIAEG
ncbi:hypothetical protein GCM10027169_19170 [Gordonia jinhuaensis]|uniref:SF3 helicase domain-containing protein n=1 Tax=Gordonia jinhuaensis TaxID=1517702 RepID=A0A916T133_9ACTN|nr:phage/plasmid primase, P4 family [Gordonia jinhuaensis]GGB27002.1 hypothetical protein GCM10011489_13910 [Gordonia jinhuaensis]